MLNVKKLFTKVLSWINVPWVSHTTSSVAPDTAYYTAELSNSDTGVSTKTMFGVGSGGLNHGIWSTPLGTWLVHSDGERIFFDGKNSSIMAGDTVTVIWHGGSYLTNSSKRIDVDIPLRRLILANSVSVDSATLITRQNGAYTHGSAASAGVEWTSVNSSISEGGVFVSLERTTTTNAVNNGTIGISMNITLSFS